MNMVKLSKIRVWANEHILMKYLVICLTITYALVAYNSQ